MPGIPLAMIALLCLAALAAGWSRPRGARGVLGGGVLRGRDEHGGVKPLIMVVLLLVAAS